MQLIMLKDNHNSYFLSPLFISYLINRTTTMLYAFYFAFQECVKWFVQR